MPLANQLTLSIVSHGHGLLVEALVGQLDSIPELTDVHLVVTLNQPDESLKFEQTPTQRLRLSIIRNPVPLGFGANHNNAFTRCCTPWFAILNPDLSLSSDIFSALIQTAVTRGSALVAPLVVNSLGQIEDSVRWNLTPWSLFKRKLRIRGEAELKDGHFRWFAGMFYLVESRAYKDIGGFDTNYFLYCEDYDICARLHLAGHRLTFEHEIKVVHDAQRASWKSRRYLFLHMRSMWKVWSSWPVWRIALNDSFRWKRLLIS
jgi:N-acetylglucosaminyl-diphospho-decaprenol L-rhamnosyltransferase